MLFADGSVNKEQKELYTFKVKFEFHDFKEASEARKIIGSHYKCMKIVIAKETCALRKEERLNVIVSCMKDGKPYSPGDLYKVTNRHTFTGYKSFQRDVSLLILQHRIKRLNNNQLIKEEKIC